MPRSGIGECYVWRFDTGAVSFTTELGPIHSLAAIPRGQFLVGYQGYGEFSTLRYSADGTVVGRWPTHGHYVSDGGGIRVIEMRNDNRDMRLVRILPGGTVVRGSELPGYYTSEPSLRSDGTIVLFRAGSIWAAKNVDLVEQLDVFEPDVNWIATPMVAGEGCLLLGCDRHWTVPDGAGGSDVSLNTGW